MKRFRRSMAALLPLALLCIFIRGQDIKATSVSENETEETGQSGQNSQPEDTNETDTVRAQYEEYCARLASIEYKEDIGKNGFTVVEGEIFPIDPDEEDSVWMIPAFEEQYSRLALFFTDSSGKILYKTENLEMNNRVLGQMKQQNIGLATVAFRDLNQDGRTDVVIMTYCANDSGQMYKVGDVLFQSSTGPEFYRDYRIADKINRFGMNKSAESITAFVRDGYSTEFLYTATTLQELLDHDFMIIADQSYSRTFGKLGKLQVIPGIYRISDYDIFLVYLVNEEGYILSSLQPMGDYDNLYALKGINCRDIDGDGLKDIVVLARYSYEGKGGMLLIANDYSIYYQRTNGFSADTEIKKEFPCSEDDTMETVVEKARAYWGWQTEDD